MYIFGYGSLINEASRQLTGETGNAYPALVKGLERHWSKVDSAKISPLVVREGAGACNGVLIQVSEEKLSVFDQREAGYRRVELSRERIALIDNTFALNGPVYVYVTDEVVEPCHINPIAQTYIDTVMAGCLRYSADFARSFIETTKGWHFPIIDDRQSPLYPRLAGVKDDDRDIIDSLMP